MKEPSLDAKKRSRDRLVNICSNGHTSAVHGLFCSSCGAKIDRKHNERSWGNISFNQSDPFSLLLELEDFSFDEVFLSAFNTSVLLITNCRKARLLRDINCIEDDSQNMMEFTIPTIEGNIENVATDNQRILIQSEGKLWDLDWIHVLNNTLKLSEVTITGKMRKLLQASYIYASTAKQILELTSKARFTINSHLDSEIVSISSYGDNLLVTTKDRDGHLSVQTNSISDRRTLTQEIPINREEDEAKITSAVGPRYYAVFTDTGNLQIGSLKKLLTSQRPEYKLKIEENIEDMFFVRDFLYTISNNAIHRWDLNNFMGRPEYRKPYVNTASMKPVVNFEHNIICIPIRQGQNEYLEIVDLSLRQLSRSFAFPQPLKAFSILNNQVFAITKEENNTKIYIG
ncbi:MAG: hypothetical protein ACOCG6_07780 [Candidatus Cloacimonadaceae bacterium]|jgi:hypothetical protein